MIKKTIRIDFFKPYKEKIEITQGTKDSVIFHFQLTGGGLPIDLTACDVIFYALKPDGTFVFNNCVTTSATAGKADYTVTEQTAILNGDLECWVLIMKTGKTLHSQQFAVTVKPVPDYTAAVESTSEFTDLEVALTTIAALEAAVAQNAADIAALQPAYSLAKDANGLHLVNDETTPTNGKYYGIEGGVRGFFTPSPEEEGSWTPSLKAETTNPTVSYTRRNGYYTKIGKLVIAQFGIILSSASGGSGRLVVDDLPFGVATYGDLPYNACSYSGTTGIVVNDRGLIFNGTYLMIGWDGGGSMLSAPNLTNAFTLFATFMYYTND